VESFVTTTDLYEATYYFLNGCELTEIAGTKVNGKLNCELTFNKSDISQLQLNYLQGKASVNIFQFRRAYGQIHSWVLKAKKDFTVKPSPHGGSL
jgi:hypothetical protein